MESNNQNADLHEFFKQLLTIDKLKKIVNCNQNIFGKHEDSDHNIKSHGDTLDELMNTSLTSHATNIQEKLFITTALFEDFKSQRRKKGITDFKLCQQLSGLGASLISIGNEIRIMRQDNAAIERKSKVCCTPTQNDGTLSQKMDVKQNKMSVSEMRCYKRIIDKIELLLSRIDNFNLSAEIRTSMKFLARMVLHALIQRSVNQTRFSNEIDTTNMSNSACSILSRQNPYI